MNAFLTPAVLARVVPFVLFMVFLALRGHWPESLQAMLDAKWIYGIGVVVVSAAMYFYWPRYQELGKQAPRLGFGGWCLSVLVGVVVFYLWIKLDKPWMILGEPTASPFQPVDEQGQLIWSLVLIRWVGAALMVPLMEELFWRSYLMRWIDQQDFEQFDPKAASYKAVALSTFAFMLAHTQWLAAIVAGLAYAWLYKRTGSLWAPVVAHGVTNGVLGIWVVLMGNWVFW